MASETASSLKAKWMALPDAYFQPLTFEQLYVGEKFICLPSPGDNRGHGGLRGTHRIFTKTHKRVNGACRAIKLSYGFAVDNRDITSDFLNSMPVIRLV